MHLSDVITFIKITDGLMLKLLSLLFANKNSILFQKIPILVHYLLKKKKMLI